MEYTRGFWSGRNEVRVLIQSFLWIISCQCFAQGLAHLNKLTTQMFSLQQHRWLNNHSIEKEQEETCPNHDTDRHSCLVCCIIGSLPSPFWRLVLDQELNDFNSAAAWQCVLAWPVLLPSCLALFICSKEKKGSHIQRLRSLLLSICCFPRYRLSPLCGSVLLCSLLFYSSAWLPSLVCSCVHILFPRINTLVQ